MKEGEIMSRTGDNNKKKKDSNALNRQKNEHAQSNAQHGKHDYSKKTDHL
jgi:hypothetical protein